LYPWIQSYESPSMLNHGLHASRLGLEGFLTSEVGLKY
jgi:hypothetical protein